MGAGKLERVRAIRGTNERGLGEWQKTMKAAKRDFQGRRDRGLSAYGSPRAVDDRHWHDVGGKDNTL